MGGSGGNIAVSAKGTDPDGDDALLKWAFTTKFSHNNVKTAPVNTTGTGPNFANTTYFKNRVPGNTVTSSIVLTDQDGLSTSLSKNTTVPRDPMIFDLNMDGKTEIKGGAVAKNGVELLRLKV